MTRRTFFELGATGLGLVAGAVLAANSRLLVLFRKIKGRVRTETVLPAVAAHAAQLPVNGEQVSLELALNSRCTSDADGDPELFHWGMFDTTARLSSDQIRRIVDLADHCRVPEARTDLGADQEMLTFSIDASSQGYARQVSMIANGMQQQAVCLACAALGVGLVFESQGPDGALASSQQFVTTKMRLGAMKPSYNGSFWNATAPIKERPWMTGNLSDPERDGHTPLVAMLRNFRFENPDGVPATTSQLSQLLWAARGRTPHLYKSNPWGLTIPTWQGMQTISSVYVAAGSQLYKYVNWKNGRPTHRLEIENMKSQPPRLSELAPTANCFVTLATNELHARALWEVGYQVLNIILQASALGISYQTLILNQSEGPLFSGIQMGIPAAVVAFQVTDVRVFKKL